jgi:hypothetical protein
MEVHTSEGNGDPGRAEDVRMEGKRLLPASLNSHLQKETFS